MWYGRYDPGELVVTVDDGEEEGMNGADRPGYEPEVYENPGLAAYE